MTPIGSAVTVSIQLATIIEEFEQHNVKVKIVTEPFDERALRLLLGNASMFVEQIEHEKKVDCMRRGRHRAKQQRELQ